jgi:hypothetical protein
MKKCSMLVLVGLAVLLLAASLPLAAQPGGLVVFAAPMWHCNNDPPDCPGGAACVNGRCVPPPKR